MPTMVIASHKFSRFLFSRFSKFTISGFLKNKINTVNNNRNIFGCQTHFFASATSYAADGTVCIGLWTTPQAPDSNYADVTRHRRPFSTSGPSFRARNNGGRLSVVGLVRNSTMMKSSSDIGYLPCIFSTDRSL
jgi:hypothetical protein